jgi:glycosyltransferase involved in cell wall biosynthesis
MRDVNLQSRDRLLDMDQSSQSARIRQYEIDTLLAEVTYLEKASGAPGTAATGIKNLQNRPHIVKIIESRPFGLLFGFTQHLIWALKNRFPASRRSSAATAAPRKIFSAKTASMPDLTQIDFDKSILVTRPKILIDVTPTSRHPEARGGIPRVVREFAKAAAETGLALPVYINDGQLFSYFEHKTLSGPIKTDSEDIYVIVDIFWYFVEEYKNIVASATSNGTKIAVLVHDIFPLRYPSLYPEEVPPAFKIGLVKFLSFSDYCLSVSKTGQEDIREYLDSIHLPNISTLKFDSIPLGMTPQAKDDGDVRQTVADLFASDRVFLSVGTLEPRKGYGISLDACERAWRSGADFSYVIIGHYGWRSQALRERIGNHPENGKRLFWVQDANDKELEFAYARCRSLIQSSIAEGFGLPVIEASLLGAPVIASDLPVFREIGGGELTYFPVGSPDGLAEALLECLRAPRRTGKVPLRSWSDSVRTLAACLSGRSDGDSGHGMRA